MAKGKYALSTGAAPLGIEAQLWVAADPLRRGMDVAEYKHECFPNTLGSGRDSPISPYLVPCA
jgi:hypothetical protein